MKADASYNDLTGTIAADITDHGTSKNELGEVVEKYGINPKEFEAVGIHYYNGYREDTGKVSLTVILMDLSAAQPYMIL